MASYTTLINKRYYPPLLEEELLAIQGVTAADVAGMDGTRRCPQGSAIVWSDDLVSVIPQVETDIASHIADPAPGPLGLAQGDLDQAWSEISLKIAATDPNVAFFRAAAPDFNLTVESALARWGDVMNEKAVVRALAWMLYCSTRALGLPRPNDYDPYVEATANYDPETGEIVWTPVGPPW